MFRSIEHMDLGRLWTIGGLVYVWVTHQGGWKDGIGLRLDANGNGAVSLSTFS
jgi:hypothetical protein